MNQELKVEDLFGDDLDTASATGENLRSSPALDQLKSNFSPVGSLDDGSHEEEELSDKYSSIENISDNSPVEGGLACGVVKKECSDVVPEEGSEDSTILRKYLEENTSLEKNLCENVKLEPSLDENTALENSLENCFEEGAVDDDASASSFDDSSVKESLNGDSKLKKCFANALLGESLDNNSEMVDWSGDPEIEASLKEILSLGGTSEIKEEDNEEDCYSQVETYYSLQDEGEEKLIVDRRSQQDLCFSHGAYASVSFSEEDKKYKCKQCGYLCPTKSNCARHVESVHLKRKRFSCNQCPYKSTIKANLERHLKYIHNNLKDFSCSQCRFKASLQSHLDIHIKSVHCKPTSFSCKDCKYETHKKRNLEDHIENTHLPIKIYACESCS